MGWGTIIWYLSHRQAAMAPYPLSRLSLCFSHTQIIGVDELSHRIGGNGLSMNVDQTSLDWRQMAMENNVSSNFCSAFVKCLEHFGLQPILCGYGVNKLSTKDRGYPPPSIIVSHGI